MSSARPFSRTYQRPNEVIQKLTQINSTFQILFYALRPAFIRTQTLTLTHLVNLLTQLFFDYIILHTLGPRALLYFLFSSFFAGSLHPCAGHFIAEHYVWDGLSQETYSYYGKLNWVAYNVRFSSLSPLSSVLTSDIAGWLPQ
jgi:hypothetical protein